MDNAKTKKLIKEIIIMTFGMMVGTAAVHFFLIPSNLVIGSISGLSIVIHTLIPALPISIITFIVNAILLVLANFLIGKEFGFKTIYTSLIMSPMLAFCEKFFPVKESIMQDPWFDLLCFVLLLGFTQTILFSVNASSGGLDIIAKIINKYTHANIGVCVTISGALICMSAFLIPNNPPKMVIIGLIGTYVNGVVLNNFSTGMNSKKRACIISERYEDIRNFVINDLHRGVTIYDVRGGYQEEPKVELEILLTNSEFVKVMEFIDQNNIKAFITAGDVHEIYGEWNEKKKTKQKQLSK